MPTDAPAVPPRARGGRLAGLRRGLAMAALIAGPVGCLAPGPSSPAPQASEPPELGMDWGRASSIERPANYQETVSPSFVGAHPILRIHGQAMMTDVVSLPDGGFVAVGYVPPEWQPVAWTSPDGMTWALHSLGTSDFTFPMAVAAGPDGTMAAVGRSGNEPTAWTTTDGLAWERHAVATLGGGTVAERMTAVAATADGFVAGGSAGPELLDRNARFWRSSDGLSWTPVADDPAAFANAEVRSITPFEGGFVAVGIVGSVQDHTGAVAWTSPDGETWTRVDDPDFEGGEAVAVAPAPFGGLVAVGNQVDRRMALVWTSPDGRAWTRAPDEPSRGYSGGYAWMTDVIGIGDLAIAIGDVQGLQRGTAMAWLSRDGRTWTRSRMAPVQEQGEFYAIAAGGPGAVVVGSYGAPDSYVPTVWFTPGR